MRKLFLPLLLVLAAVVAWEAMGRRGMEAGTGAQAFAATATDGQRVELASYRGRSAVLLNFFSVH